MKNAPRFLKHYNYCTGPLNSWLKKGWVTCWPRWTPRRSETWAANMMSGRWLLSCFNFKISILVNGDSKKRKEGTKVGYCYVPGAIQPLSSSGVVKWLRTTLAGDLPRILSGTVGQCAPNQLPAELCKTFAFSEFRGPEMFTTPRIGDKTVL
jgi:hypothetical protein